jgi:hypothetical protein
MARLGSEGTRGFRLGGQERVRLIGKERVRL